MHGPIYAAAYSVYVCMCVCVCVYVCVCVLCVFVYVCIAKYSGVCIAPAPPIVILGLFSAFARIFERSFRCTGTHSWIDAWVPSSFSASLIPPSTLSLCAFHPSQRYDHLLKSSGMTEAQLLASGVRRISPAFCMVATALPPEQGKEWLTAEALGLFQFHDVISLDGVERASLLAGLFPLMDTATRQGILSVAERLSSASSVNLTTRITSTPNASSTAADVTQLLEGSDDGISLRLLLRLARRAGMGTSCGTINLHDVVHRNFMSSFMPPAVREAIDCALQGSIAGSAACTEVPDMLVMTDTVRFGDLAVPRRIAERPELVPNPKFLDIPAHRTHMMEMAKDYSAGEKHLLLIGNQVTNRHLVPS